MVNFCAARALARGGLRALDRADRRAAGGRLWAERVVELKLAAKKRAVESGEDDVEPTVATLEAELEARWGDCKPVDSEFVLGCNIRRTNTTITL